jgi:predicted DNA-binding antitoxin AbrB/MazE fold protein
MNQVITAIYADGVLRPLVPLELPEQTEVVIEVKPIVKTNGAAASAMDERARIHQALVDAGLVQERRFPTPPSPPISEEERERLGRVFSVGKPLSEIIIEEREECF